MSSVSISPKNRRRGKKAPSFIDDAELNRPKIRDAKAEREVDMDPGDSSETWLEDEL